MTSLSSSTSSTTAPTAAAEHSPEQHERHVRHGHGHEQPMIPSPRTAGTDSAPVRHERAVPLISYRPFPRLLQQGAASRSLSGASAAPSPPLVSLHTLQQRPPVPFPPLVLSPARRGRNGASLGRALSLGSVTAASPTSAASRCPTTSLLLSPRYPKKQLASLSDAAADAATARALQQNDAMIYLDGPQVYACQHCRTHLTSHDDIISKSFHGRHGRAYLLDQAVNVRIGPPEDRMLMTGLHAVCDIHCQRCNTLIGWTYQKAYEASQKYKEGKYIIEKIHLYLEESDYFTAPAPAGERCDRWRQRSISWGSHTDGNHDPNASSTSLVYEYPEAASPMSTRSLRNV